MKQLVAVASFVLTSIVGWHTAHGEAAYPSQQIRLIVPQSPGTASDYLARMIGLNLATRFAQPFIIENIAGAGGLIGSTTAAHAPADGYTLALIGPAHVSNVLLKRSQPYRLFEDFTAVAQIASMPNVILVSTLSGISSVASLAELAKQKPGELNYGSVGTGSSSHLAVELFVHTVGIKATHVPYRTQATLIGDLIGGRIQFYSAPLAAAMSLIQNKQARALMVGSVNRVNLLPDTPTMRELGYRDYTSESWFGIVGPAGIDATVVQRLNTELSTALVDPTVRAALVSQGALPSYGPPKTLMDVQRAELEQTQRILKLLDIKPE